MCSSRYIALHGGFLHSRVEFTTVQEVPDRSTQMHSKYIPTYLTMVSVKKKNVFVRLYRYSDTGAEFTTAQKVSDRSTQMHSKYIPTYLTMVSVKKKRMCSSGYIGTRTPERSSPLHKK